MFFLKRKNEEITKRAAILTALFVVIILFVLTVVPILLYEYIYINKIYRGVSIDNVLVGNMTKEEATVKIEKYLNDLQRDGVTFIAENKQVQIRPTTIAINDPDLNYDLIDFDVNNVIQSAYNVGRSDNIVINLINQAKSIIKGAHIKGSFIIDEVGLIDALKENFVELEDPGTNPQIVYTNNDITVEDGKSGKTLNYQQAVSDLKQSIQLGEQSNIFIKTEPFNPSLTKNDIQANISLLTEFIERVDKINLHYNDKIWVMTKADIKPLLYFKKNNTEVQLIFDQIKLENYLINIKNAIDVAPVDAVLKFNEDKTRVIEFTPQKSGVELSIIDSIIELNSLVFQNKEKVIDINLVVQADKPNVVIGDLNELGIKELIGTGISDYSGSPTNRRHNIAVGARSFNGVVLAPGDEFSALKYIGNVDENAGYLPELVIKGNKTIPEYGGGLCQVSTTMFRSAINAGVKITARANHSYAVSYYSPAGTDATIYSPAPDFKFLNDTGAYIIIHTINDTANSKLYFQIWGTDDGRKVSLSEPVKYDYVSPPPTKIIETVDLPVGQKRCTESAHAGLKAYFDRFITRADGAIEEERFSSVYRPWQAVCLVGVEKLSDEVVPEESTESTQTPDPNIVN